MTISKATKQKQLQETFDFYDQNKPPRTTKEIEFLE